MIDTAIGAAVIGGRAAARGADLATRPLRAVGRLTGVSGPVSRAADGAASVGREARRDLLRAGERLAIEVLGSREVARIAEAAVSGPLAATVTRSLAQHRVADELLDAVLTPELAGAVVRRVIEAGATESFVAYLIESGQTEPLVAHVLEAGAIERVVRHLLASPLLPEIVGQVMTSPEVEVAVRGSLEPARMEAIATELVASPVVERWLREVLVSPQLEAAVLAVLESDVALRVTDWVTESEEMAKVINAFATSPEVRTVLAEQSMGMAGEITTGVRRRSVTLDDAAERTVRRILRRPVEDA